MHDEIRDKIYKETTAEKSDAGQEMVCESQDKKVIAGRKATKRTVAVPCMISALVIVGFFFLSVKANGATLHTQKERALSVSQES